MTTDNYWIGKPEFRPYLLRSIIRFLYSMGFIFIIYAILSLISLIDNIPLYNTRIWLIPALIIGEGLYSLIKRIYEFKYLRYEITDNDLVIRRGKKDQSIKIISLNNIKFIESKICFNDKFYGTRTIKLFVGDLDKTKELKFDELESVENADNILLRIRKGK